MAFVLTSCSDSNTKSPIPESHPAYKFYQIANAGPTSLDVCESCGGVEIYLIDYEMIEPLAQGVIKIRYKYTGKMYLGVSFSEGGMMTTVDLCCWPWEQPTSEAEFYNDRGVIYRRNDFYDKAISNFTRAIDMNPQYAEAYKNRGFAYGLKEKHDEAISDLDKAIELSPQYAEALRLRGRNYADKGLYDKAISDYSRAIELNPRFAIAYINRGAAYANKGQHEKVVYDLSKAIEVNPRYAIAYYHRAIAHIFLKNYDSSWDDIKKAQALGCQIDPSFIAELRRVTGREK